MNDPTNPDHYTSTSIEPINVIEDWTLGFHLGNVVKYVKRFTVHGRHVDLEKARWYLDRLIATFREGEKGE